MKFAKLYLKSFGPFTGKWLNFEQAGSDLHLIYGPNEAGKSSLLRAVGALLFGIPERTSDNFLHDNTVLRIGGILMRSDGRRLPFMRRKGRSKTLLSWKEAQADQVTAQTLEDGVLQEFLGTLDAAQFRDMFGLDHDRLVQGGKDILSGKGEVGQSLFEAGTGLLGLKDLRSRIDTEASALFSPRGSNPLINKAIAEYEEARREVRTLSVKSSDWVRLKKERDEVHSELDKIAQDLQIQRRERERLMRIKDNLPLIGRRAEYLKELHDLGEVPVLPEEAKEERRTIVRDRERAEADLKAAQAKILKLQDELRSLEIPYKVLDHSRRIEDLYQQVQSYRGALRQLPALEAERQSAQNQALARLGEIQPDLPLEHVDRLRLGRSDLAKIRHLIAEHSKRSTVLEGLQVQGSDKQQSLSEAERQLAEFPTRRDLSQLEAALEAVTAEGDLERRLTESGLTYEAEQTHLMDQIASLWRGALDRFERLAVPLRTQVQQFEQEAAEITSERHLIEERITTLSRDRQTLASQQAVLVSTGEVPNHEQLESARQRRDQGWQLIRQGYIDQTADVSKRASDYDPDRPLPEAFEHTITRADRLADLLRTDSMRVTEYAVLNRRLSEIDEDLAEAQRRKERLNTRSRYYDLRWDQVLAALDLPGLTPRQLVEWLEARGQILERLKTSCKKAHEVQRLERAIENGRKALEHALQATALGGVDPHEPLTVLLNRCRNSLRTLTEQNRHRTKLETERDTLQHEREALETRLKQAEVKLNEWRGLWQSAVEPIGLEVQALPAEVEARLDLLDELFKSLDHAARLTAEIQGHRDRVSGFSKELTELVQGVGTEPPGREAGDVAEALYRQYQKAKQDRLKHHQLEERLREESGEASRLRTTIEHCQKRLQALCDQAHCTEVSQLPEIEEQSRRKIVLSTQIQAIEEQLAAQNGMPFNELLGEAQAEDRDSLTGRISDWASHIEVLENQRLELVRGSERLQGELRQMDGSAQAAFALQRGQEALARIRGGAEEYVRLKLSAVLLRRAIEIYRERNQGPVLKRAGEFFSVLTCGAFARLDTDFGEDDSLLLVGVRNPGPGERVSVEGMSMGTLDQLYLALRLAAIDRYLETNEAIPLIIDDILIQFDEERSSATLRVLWELSQKTQVLLFTHHRHLLDLARQHIAPEAVVIHELEPRYLA